jgi:hypothetical protein
MQSKLFAQKDDTPVSLYYPTHGRLNVLRKVKGVKVKSFVGPHGPGITVLQDDGRYRSLSLRKCVMF